MAKQPESTESQPTSFNVPALSSEHVAQLLQMMLQGQQNSPSAEIAKALEIMSAHVASTEKLGQEIGRTVSKSNAIGDDTGASDFAFDPACQFCVEEAPHPGVKRQAHAHPKETLYFIAPNGKKKPRQVFFCHFPQREDALSPLEIRLFNQFKSDVDARGGYKSGRGWSARITDEGSRLDIYIPAYTQDQRSSLPPLAQILAELLNGSAAVDPNNLLATVQSLQEKIAQLEANSKSTKRVKAEPELATV